MFVADGVKAPFLWVGEKRTESRESQCFRIGIARKKTLKGEGCGLVAFPLGRSG